MAKKRKKKPGYISILSQALLAGIAISRIAFALIAFSIITVTIIIITAIIAKYFHLEQSVTLFAILLIFFFFVGSISYIFDSSADAKK